MDSSMLYNLLNQTFFWPVAGIVAGVFFLVTAFLLTHKKQARRFFFEERRKHKR